MSVSVFTKHFFARELVRRTAQPRLSLHSQGARTYVRATAWRAAACACGALCAAVNEAVCCTPSGVGNKNTANVLATGPEVMQSPLAFAARRQVAKLRLHNVTVVSVPLWLVG